VNDVATDEAVAPLPRSVRIERSGGFGGMKTGTDLQLDALTAAQRAALTTVLAKVPATRSAPASAPMPDRFTYRLHVVDADGGQRTLVLGEDELPEPLQALARPTLP
jgi:hypothetical protein